MRKRKTAARLTASALAVCMVAGCMPAGAAQQVEAADLTDDSWQEIQSIVGRYYGEWNTPMEPMDGSREGIDMPNTALLGNGDVGVASGGTEEEKKFYFSKGDFWAYGPSPGLHEPGMMAIGGVTIGKSQEGITTVEAEDFVDAGDVTIEGGGTSVGYIDTGDWMEYTVSIDEPGTYKLNYRVAVNSAGTVEFVANGKTLATTDLPRTGGWSSWKTMSDKVEFAEAGEYTIRLNVVQGGWNFDKLTLELDNSLPEEESENLALNKPIKVCSSYTDQGVTYGGDYVVDGDTSTKWCSLHDDESTHWAIVDLGEKKNIGYYKLVHSGIVGETQHNTVDYQLQYLDSEEENWDSIEQVDEALWKDMDVVTGNTSTETSKSFETPVSARYIRLLITNPAPSNKAARIHELELREEAPLQYYEKQDILNAEIQTTQELAEVPTEMKTWLSSDKNIMVTELTSNGTNAADFQVETWASTENKDIRPVSAANDDDSVTITRSTEKRNEEDEGAWISKAALSTKIIGADDVTAKSDNDAGKGTLTFTLEPEQTVYIVTAVGGGGRTYTASGDLWEGEIEPETEAAEILSTVSDEAAVSELNTARQEWWKDYWSTSYVDFGTEDANLNLVQKYYYGAQYILGSSAREDKTAPGLYGVWRTNDKPGFRGDYHLNYNFIASFYGTNSSNRPELSLSGVQALLDFVPEGQRRASSVEELKRINADFVEQKIEKGDIDPDKGIEGAILFPVGIGPNGSVTDDAYHNEALDAAYNSYLMTEYYDYTLDKEFLENGVYDYMKQAVAFYEAWLEKEETTENEDGYEYVLYAGYNEGSWAINPAVELAALKSTLRNLIKFSEDIGKDEDKRADWIDIYEHLGDQPTTVVDGKTVLALGEKQWDGSRWVDLPSPILGDGNALPLDAMIPGGVYNYFSSPEDLQMIQDTIDVFSQRGAWSQINNFSRLFPEAVKSRYPIDSVVTNLVNVIKSQMEANLRINDNTHGLEKSGSTETINSMMLISEDGITKIFPNWYTDKDAKFANLRAKGAFVVSAEYDGAAQEAKNVTITSEAGADMTLVSPWAEGMIVKDSKGNVVETTKGTVPNWEDQENATYTFSTTAGETYTVEKGEETTEERISIRVDGDSFAQGGYGEEKTFSVLTAEAIGADLTNKAQGGWMINNAWQAMINSGDRLLETPSPYDVHLINLGYNDVRKNGNQPNFAEETAHRMKAMIAYMNLGTMRDENDTGITWTGSWNLFHLGADAQGTYLKYTGDPNASASFEIEGDTLTLGTFVLAKDAGTLKIEVDGETKYKELMQGGDSGYTPTAVVLRGLGEGTHEVTVSKSDTTGGFIYIDYIGTEAEDAPRILVNSITYMREDQYGAFPGWTNGNKEVADETNAAFAEMIEETFGSNVEMVDQSSFDPNVLDDVLAPDLVHPNTEGHKIMADNIILTYYKIMFANNTETLKTGESRQLNVRTLDENAEVTWESDNTEVAAVDGNGTVTALQEGRVNIKASIDENTYAVCEVEVVKNEETEKPSKTTLEYFLNKAKEHQANGDVDNCVESIKNLFAEAIAEGEAVMADENATYEEVMDATVKLMKAIQALDFKAADKTDLEMAVELAQSIDLTKYVEAGQTEFQQALAAAQEVLADGDAMQADADTAWNALVDAISNLRLKADKSTLEDLLNSVADLDLSQYTEESAAVFRTALANAQAVLADETLAEEDQKTVDDAVQALSDAKDQLQLKDTFGDNNGGNGDGNTGTGDGSDNTGNGDGNTGNGDSQTPGTGNSNAKADAPKTGDTAPIMGLIMLGILSGAAVLTISRKRVK